MAVSVFGNRISQKIKSLESILEKFMNSLPPKKRLKKPDATNKIPRKTNFMLMIFCKSLYFEIRFCAAKIK